MDFSKVNIQKILKNGLKDKFANFPPKDFEDFISQLFRDNGYAVEQTKYVGDYGVDLIAKKNEKNLAIQVKRYSSNNKVGVKDVNQVLGGKNYYGCSEAIIITTSSFTKQVEELAKKTGVHLWDWSTLQKYICDTYLDGKNYFEYYKETDGQMPQGTKSYTVMLKNIVYSQAMKGNWIASQIFFDIKNDTDNNISAVVFPPIIITVNNRQIESRGALTGYFTSGKIYAGCAVQCCFTFASEQWDNISRDDKIVVKFIIDSEEYEQILQIGNIPRSKGATGGGGSGCFIATAAYGTPLADEINILRYWRDNYLVKQKWGNYLLQKYYRHSPPVADFIANSEFWKKLTRLLLAPIIRMIAKSRSRSI